MMDAKTKAIVSHITIIGWVVALIFNEQQRDSFAGFYIRQMIGLYLLSVIVGIIPVLNVIINIVFFAFWLLSLLNAAKGKYYTVPLAGEYFQQFFRSL